MGEPTKTARPRRRMAPAARRAEILDAALDVFAERGYRGASLATIAERVGLTQQGLLHYFPTKEALLVEVLALRDTRDLAALASIQPTPTLDGLATIVELNAHRRGIVQSYTVLSADSVTEDHPARDFFTDRFTRIRHAVTTMVREEIGEDLPAGMTPERAAVLLIAVMDGLQLQWLLDEEGEIDMPEVFGDLLRLLRAG